ncbi:MAG: dihydrolipoamide acetyltransferase family protein [Pseudomonadota bacterium]
MIAFRMPSLGADMENGKLIEWLKEPGDDIKRGDILAVVETVKGAIEIESFDEGVLEKHVATLGQSIPVGETLALIRGIGENSEEVDAGFRAESVSGDGAPKATPAARKRAHEASLDLAGITPGTDGVIGLEQVNAAISTMSEKPDADKTGATTKTKTVKPGLDLTVMRKSIGAAMARSKRDIPHYYVSSPIDCMALTDWLERENEKRSVAERILYAAPLIKAAALALLKTPNLNGFYTDEDFHSASGIHIGVATSLRGGGLIAPALHDADKLSVDNIMTHLRDLVGRVRTGRLRASEMSDPTVTISILGEDTADAVAPVIYPPQVAIIGCGSISKRPWVIDGDIKIRDIITVTVAGDHRVSDGRAAAQFLRHLSNAVQQPEEL